MIDFSKYRSEASSFIAKANSLWSKVTFLSVAEILEGEVNLREMEKLCMGLSDKCTASFRDMSNRMDLLTDEEFDELEPEFTQIESIFNLADDKFSHLDDIISDLRRIQDTYDEKKGNKLFADIQPINLGESIQLRRFR